MSKVVTTIMIMTGLMALLVAAGIGDSSTSQLLQALFFDNPTALKSGELFTGMAAIFSIFGVVTSIIIGSFTRQSTESLVVAALALLLGGWIVGDMTQIILSFDESAFPGSFAFFGSAVKTFMIVLTAGFIVSLISWWRGSDG